MDFGTIESIEIGQNLDTGEDVRIAQVNITGEDTVTVELPFPEGCEFCAAAGDTVYFSEVDSGLLVGNYVVSTLPVDSTLEDGETEIFARSGSSRASKVRLKSDGTLVFNDGTDFAVRFEKLESALNAMITELDNLVKALQEHTHLTAGTGSPSIPTNVAAIIAPKLDISDAKAEKVQL